MPGGFTHAAATAILNLVMRNQSYNFGNGAFLALYTGVQDGDAGQVTEVPTTVNNQQTGYARASITWGNPSVSSGVVLIRNENAITFNPALQAWGNITHVGIVTAQSGGNIIAVIPLSAARTVNSGDTVTVPANSLSFSLD